MPPQLISGDIGPLPPDDLRNTLKQAGISRFDTAARYGNGESEKRLGAAKFAEDFSIDTKVLVSMPSDGSLSATNIRSSVESSLQKLGVNQVNVLYCHAPDFETPIAEQAKAMDEQYRLGRFKHLGVSNFPVSMLQEWLDVAEKEDYVKPSVYQGQYNLLVRNYEEDLFPLLRKHGIAFNAYSPLAGGFLLGHYTEDGVQAGKRFSIANPYTEWYDHPSMHAFVKQLRAISERAGLGMDELSLRWLRYHSGLQGQDGIILGGSKVQHFQQSVAHMAKGPLDEEVASELHGLFDGVREDAAAVVDHGPDGKFAKKYLRKQ